jgi:hypothetical protein
MARFLLARLREEEQAALVEQSTPDIGTALARVNAMRAIVKQWEYWEQASTKRGPWDQACRHLAKIYVAHPDYRDDWRP